MQKNTFNLGEPRLWLPPTILMIMTSKLFQLRSHNTVKKLLLVMKMIVIIMTTCLLQVSAASFAQKMTMVRKNTTLAQVLKEITIQTGYEVLYSDQNIDVDRKIDVNFNNTDLKEVLENCLEGQKLDFAIEDKVIVIKKRAPTFLERVVATLTSIDAAGRVVDAEGNALPGATVKVKNSGRSVSTNVRGEFVLRGVEDGAVLVVSFIGYVPKEIKAAKELGDVVLEVSLSKLDESGDFVSFK